MDYTNEMSSVRRADHRGELYGSDQPLGFPDPFAVATIGGEQTRTTSVIKKTLNPYWNEAFDMYVLDTAFHQTVLLTDFPGEAMRTVY